MERKKLVYNAIQDIWKIASSDSANKKAEAMTDEDWSYLISAIDASGKKYRKLGTNEETFYSTISMAFLDLIEKECKAKS